MPKYVFIILSNPVFGKEREYNRWYDDEHIGDVLKVPGFISARRYPAAPGQLPSFSDRKWEYLAIYDIETDDLSSTLAEMRSRAGGALMPISDAIDMKDCFAMAYRAD